MKIDFSDGEENLLSKILIRESPKSGDMKCEYGIGDTKVVMLSGPTNTIKKEEYFKSILESSDEVGDISYGVITQNAALTFGYGSYPPVLAWVIRVVSDDPVDIEDYGNATGLDVFRTESIQKYRIYPTGHMGSALIIPKTAVGARSISGSLGTRVSCEPITGGHNFAMSIKRQMGKIL